MKDVSRTCAFFHHFEQLNGLMTRAYSSNRVESWGLAIGEFKEILSLCEISTHYEEELLEALISRVEVFKDLLVCQQDINLQKVVKECFSKLLILFAKQMADIVQESYIRTVIILLEDYASKINLQQNNNQETVLPLYLLAHEYVGYVKESRLESKIVASIAKCYSQKGNPRLASYYYAYNHFLDKISHKENEVNSLMALIKEEAYFLYSTFLDPLFLFRQITINQQDDIKVCYNLYDRLCELGDRFLAEEDYLLAGQCYERLKALLATYPATKENHASRCIEGIGRIKARQKLTVLQKDELAILKLQEKKETLRSYREECYKLLIPPEKVPEETPENQQKTLQGQLTDYLVDWVGKLCDEVIEQLGPAPCRRFSLLRLGSLAREEACFFSDLELAIVWADRKECANLEDITSYFKYFVLLLELKIIMLGETNELCGLSKQQGIELIVARMKRGLRFDEAGHYPFSGKSLLIGDIKTLSNLVALDKLFKDESLKVLRDYAEQLPFIVGDDTSLFALLDANTLYGDKELTQDFNQACQAILNQEDKKRELSYRQVIGYSLITKKFLQDSQLSLPVTQLCIKSQLLHLPQRIVATLALYYGVNQKSSQRRIEELVSCNILPALLAEILSYSIQFAFLLRLKAQWFYQQEQDELYVEEKEEGFSLTALDDKELLNSLIDVVYPFLREVFKGWQDKANQAPSKAYECFSSYEIEGSKIVLLLAEHALYCNDYVKASTLYQLVVQQPNLSLLLLQTYQSIYQRAPSLKEVSHQAIDEAIFLKQAYQPVIRASLYLLLSQNTIPVQKDTAELVDTLVKNIRQLSSIHLITKSFVISSLFGVERLAKKIKKRALTQEEVTTLLLINEFVIEAFLTNSFYSSNIVMDNLIQKLIHSVFRKEVLGRFVELIKRLNIARIDYDIYLSIYQLILESEDNNESEASKDNKISKERQLNSFNITLAAIEKLPVKEIAYQFFKLCEAKLEDNEKTRGILKQLAECKTKDGYRLTERLAYEKLQSSLQELALEDTKANDLQPKSLPLTIKVRVFCSNGEEVILHPHVIKEIINEQTGHLRHKVAESKSPEAYVHRNVAKIVYRNIALHFKEHPDFPIMAYASDILNRRLCGHGSTANDLTFFKVTGHKGDEVLWYPVLVSLTVNGPTLETVLTQKQYADYPTNYRRLAEFFILEYIKHSGDGLPRNYILSPNEQESGQWDLVGVDYEQMLVTKFMSEGLVFKEDKAREINIIYCLPEFQFEGQFYKHGFPKEALSTFANLKVDRVLHAWLDTIKAQEAKYVQLVDKHPEAALSLNRPSKHPFLLKMIFPNGILGKLAMELRVIKRLSANASYRLYPTELFIESGSSKLARMYFIAQPFTPEERLRKVTDRNFTIDSSAYHQAYIGSKKTIAQLAASDYSIEATREEIQQYYYEKILLPVDPFSQKIASKHRVTVLDFENIDVKRQLNQLQHLIESNSSFKQLHIKKCTQLDDLILKQLLQNSYDTLEVLSIHGHSKLTEATLNYLADNFKRLRVLIASGIGAKYISTLFRQKIIFSHLEVLVLNHCSNLQLAYIEAPVLTYLELASHPLLSTVDLNAPQLKYASFESNSELTYLKFTPLLSCHLNLVGANPACIRFLSADWADDHYQCCYIPAEYLGLSYYDAFGYHLSKDKSILMAAAEEGRVAVVKQFLREGVALLNQYDNVGFTPLDYAIFYGHLEIVKLMAEKIKYVFPIDRENKKGITPLSLAARKGHIEIVNYLYEQGANCLHRSSISGQTPLMVAAENGKTAMVEELLKKGAVLDEKDNKGYTALHYAASYGHLDTVKFIVAKMKAALISIELEDKDGDTPLSRAACQGYIKIVNYLHRQGANCLHRSSVDRKTPLMLAAGNGKTYMVEELIKKCGKLDEKDNEGFTALHFATITDRLETVKFLVKKIKEALIPIDLEDKRGYTPLSLAAGEGYIETVNYLHEQGANCLHRSSTNGKTPLMLAAENGETAMVEELLKKGAVLDEKDNKGYTALHYAARYGHLDTAEFIVGKMKAASLSIELEDKNGDTPLSVAACQGYIKIVNYLHRQGANCLHRSSVDRKTPLMLAAENGKTTMLEELLRKEAKLDEKDNNGFTALHYAARHGHLETVKLIAEKMKATLISIEPEDKYGYTPVSVALGRGHIEIVNYFYQQGADCLHRSSVDRQTFLMLAASNGKTSIVEELLRKGSVLDEKDINGLTALHYAARHGNLETVKFLVEKMKEASISIDLEDKEGNTPLSFVAWQGYIKIFNYLHEQGADCLHRSSVNGQTPLMLAARNGKTGMVWVLLKKGAQLNETDDYDFTALHYAARYGHLEAVKFLVEKMNEASISIELEDKKGNTPLSLAARQGYIEIVNYLHEHGANCFHKNSVNGKTSLMLAAENGKIAMVAKLVMKGGKLDEKDNNGLTALHYAAYFGHLETVKFLVEKMKEASISIELEDENGYTPLSLAASQGYIEIVNYLQEQGADCFHRSPLYGKTPLMLAAGNGKTAMVEELIKKGGKLDEKDNEGFTALHYAAYFGHLETVKFLVEKMKEALISIELEDKNGDTPLSVAAYNGHVEVVNYLNEQGADCFHRSSINGKTPLMLAAQNDKTAMVEELLRKGAKLKDKEKSGCTVLHYAAYCGHLKTVKFLVEKMKEALISIELEDNDGDTALSDAAMKGYVEIGNYLHEQGANCLHRSFATEQTPLMLAANNGKTAMVEWLIKQGASVEDKNKDGFTALQQAALNSQEEVVKYLAPLDNLAQSLKDNSETTLHYSIAYEQENCLFLLSQQENFDKLHSKNNEGYTLLHIAAGFGNLATLEYLLAKEELSYLINEKTFQGFTPLHLAAIRDKGHTRVALLIAKGASVHEPDVQGNTPLHKAVEYGQLESVKCLLEAGAKINSYNTAGQTPIDIAKNKGYDYLYKQRELWQLLKNKLETELSTNSSLDNTQDEEKQEKEDTQKSTNDLKQDSVDSSKKVDINTNSMALLLTQQGFHKNKSLIEDGKNKNNNEKGYPCIELPVPAEKDSEQKRDNAREEGSLKSFFSHSLLTGYR